MNRHIPSAPAADIGLILVACANGAADADTTSFGSSTSPEAPPISVGPTASSTAPTHAGSTSTTSAISRTRKSPGYPGAGDPAHLVEVYGSDGQVTFEFAAASGTPEWSARYVDEPIAAPSGEPMDVDGNAYLMLTMKSAAGVDLIGETPQETYDRHDRFSFESPLIAEVAEAEDFESTLTWIVGLGSRLPYSVQVNGKHVSASFDAAGHEAGDHSTLFVDAFESEDEPTDGTAVSVLDCMARTVSFEESGSRSDLVADYRGGGQPFTVVLDDRDEQCCLAADPGDTQCLSFGHAPVATVDLELDAGETVVAGLAPDDDFGVEVTGPDGSTLSYLPVDVDGDSGWVVPFEEHSSVEALDAAGVSLGTTGRS